MFVFYILQSIVCFVNLSEKICKHVPSMECQILSLHTFLSIPVKEAIRGSEGYKYLHVLGSQNLNLKYLYEANMAIYCNFTRPGL